MLFNPLHLARIARLRHLVVWLLIVALPAHNLSGVLQRVLGASHRHAPVVAEAPSLPGLPSSSVHTALQQGLRTLVATAIGEQAWALIDGDHARALARQQAAEEHAHPARPQATFSATDLRQALAASDQEPAWAAPEDASPTTAAAAPPSTAHGHGQGAHSHDGFQRHVHDAHDASVVALGEKASNDPAAPATHADAGAGTFPLPVAHAALALTPAAAPAAWRPVTTQPWHNHVSGPLERPPQA